MAKSKKPNPRRPSTAIDKPKANGEKKKRPVWLSVLKWTAIGVGVRELYLAFGARRQHKRDIFNLAQHRAAETHKRLIVIGDPDGGLINRFIGRDYDCAELCIDETGCIACPHYQHGRLEDVLPTLDTNSAVVFVNARLERVEDIDKVLAELVRVSGGDVFVATVEPWTLTSMFWPGSRRQFYEAPPDEPRFRWSPLPWRSASSTSTVLELPAR